MKLERDCSGNPFFVLNFTKDQVCFNPADCAHSSDTGGTHRFLKFQVTQIGVFMRTNIFVFPPWQTMVFLLRNLQDLREKLLQYYLDLKPNESLFLQLKIINPFLHGKTSKRPFFNEGNGNGIIPLPYSNCNSYIY